MTSQPDFANALPAPLPSPEWHDRLIVRRSAPAQALTTPGPDEAQIRTLLTIGARTPDHGKLAPWRFVVLGPDVRRQIAERLTDMAQTRADRTKAVASLAKLTSPPVTILVVSRPVEGHKVPVWEQHLSAGAVCMNLEHAAGALGFSASWITDWYSYDPDAVALFGLEANERIAGFIHVGTASEPVLERSRPGVDSLTTWRV